MPASSSSQPTIEKERLISLAANLVRIGSPSGEEGHVAEYLASYMEGEGLAVELQEVPGGRSDASRYNVIGRLSLAAAGPRLLLTGHTDVVPPGSIGWTVPPYAGEVREGRLYGRGAADMKGGIASMVEAACALRREEADAAGELVLAFVVGEEEDQSGTRYLVASDRFRADFAYVGEPTELKPVACHNGLVSVTVTVVGRSAHASRPEEGLNAIDGMHLFLDNLRALRRTVGAKTHELTGHANLTPGTIRGGEVSNMVPDRCTLSLDRRLLPGEDAAGALHEIEGVASAVRASEPQLEVSVEAGLIEDPLETPPDHRVVTALRRAIDAATGADPGVAGWTATCDAGHLSTAGRVPTVVFGPGSLSQAHKPDEFVRVDELETAARVYVLAARELLRE